MKCIKRTVLDLDIYGSIDKEYEQEFQTLKKSLPEYIKYCGEVSYDKTVEVIKNYFYYCFQQNFILKVYLEQL